MNNDIVLKKCAKCGAMVEVIKPCTCDNCGIVCCGEQMIEEKTNNKDFSFEKHLPTYEIKGNKIVVTVNHVMEEQHYIEWIAIKNEQGKQVVFLKPNTTAQVEFNFVENAKVFAYCNLHGLWAAEVK